MSVTNETDRFDYAPTPGQTEFDFDNCLIYDATHLKVYFDGVQQTSGFTVSGVGEPSGGTVTFSTAPYSAGVSQVTLLRDVPKTQLIEYPPSGPFPSSSHERALDLLTMMVQRIAEIVDSHTLHVGIGKMLSEITPEAGKPVRWKSDLSGLEAFTLDPVDSLNVITAAGDMIRGGVGAIPEKFIKGNEGDGLVVSGGYPNWKPGSVAYLVNKSGGDLVAGDVVIIDTGNDSAVKSTTIQGTGVPVLISLGSIPNNAAGIFARSGCPMTVNVQGNVARGNYLRTSATAKRAEDAGSIPTTGSFAIALTAYAGGGAGSVSAWSFGVLFSDPPYLMIRKTADESVASSTAYQDDDHLFLPVGVNEVWEFSLYLIGQSHATGKFKCQFTVPTGGTMLWENMVVWGDTIATVLKTETGTLTNYQFPASASKGGMCIKGWYFGGANAGNMKLQWAQYASYATATILFANSYLTARKIV